MRTGTQFSQAFRSGVRSGRRNIVLSVAQQNGETTLVGFIVSKAVGNAVVRNRVKRRLRECAAETVKNHPYGYYIAVRALPASKNATWGQLRHDYTGALEAALHKLETERSTHGQQLRSTKNRSIKNQDTKTWGVTTEDSGGNHA